MIAGKFTPDLKRFLLGFLLFTADIRNNIAYHLGPVGESFSGAGYSLICADRNCFDTVLSERRKCRNIALNRAVWLDCDKASGRIESLALSVNKRRMIAVDFRDNHRDITGPAVS